MDKNCFKKFNWIKQSENVFYSRDGIFVFTKEMKEYLTDFVSKKDFGIVRICAHKNHLDKLHEMIIVLKDSHYIPPHKHFNKSESFHVIDGSLAIVIFSDEGDIVKTIILAADGDFVYYRLSDELFHMVIGLSPFVVFHEITNGPFKQDDGELPIWAPNKNSCEESIKTYHKKIKNFIK